MARPRKQSEVLDYLYAEQVRQMAKFPEENTLRVMEDIVPGSHEREDPAIMRQARKYLEKYRAALTDAMVEVRRMEKHGDRSVNPVTARERLGRIEGEMEHFFSKRQETDETLENRAMVLSEIQAISKAMDKLEDCVAKGIAKKPRDRDR